MMVPSVAQEVTIWRPLAKVGTFHSGSGVVPLHLQSMCRHPPWVAVRSLPRYLPSTPHMHMIAVISSLWFTLCISCEQ
eukprot:5724651-Amphidinium_carterae.1